MDTPKITDLEVIPTDYEPLDDDGDWLISGGCVHLAIVLKEVFPERKIAVCWYDDHGRRAISHAVFYNPETGYVELLDHQQRTGWTCWGNEA